MQKGLNPQKFQKYGYQNCSCVRKSNLRSMLPNNHRIWRSQFSNSQPTAF